MNVFLVMFAYLLGSIPFGFVIGKAKGIDVRQHGSGNIGTSNVARTLGKKAALLTLLGDGLKGLVPVLLARASLHSDAWCVVVGLAAVIGHNWPVYLKFKGGKGVTTTYSAYLGIAWLPGLLTILSWVIITKRWKTSSIAALISSLLAPVFALATGASKPVIVFAVIGVALIYLRHVENIKRLLAGTENTLSQRVNIDDASQNDD